MRLSWLYSASGVLHAAWAGWRFSQGDWYGAGLVVVAAVLWFRAADRWAEVGR